MKEPPDRSNAPAAALPDELRGLTYDQATPEQIALPLIAIRALNVSL